MDFLESWGIVGFSTVFPPHQARGLGLEVFFFFQQQATLAEMLSLWSWEEGWIGSVATLDRSCGTAPVLVFYQDCNLRQERRYHHCG